MSAARRIGGAGALALLVALALAGSASAQGAIEVRTRDVTFRDDGTTRIVVSVSGAAVGSGRLGPDHFAVTENGQRMSGLRVEPLTAAIKPVVVTLLMDTSGSTARVGLRAAKPAAKAFLAGLPAGLEVAMLRAGGEVEVVSGFTSDRARLTRAIDGLKAGGKTPLYDAIVRASGMLRQQKPNAQHNVVIFSDGQDTISKASLGEAARALAGAQAPATVVLLRTATVKRQALQTLADATKGGQLISVDDPAGLTSAFARVAQAIRSQYALTYAGTLVDPRQLNIAVSVRVGGATGSDSSLYLNERKAVVAPAAEARKPLVGVFGTSSLGLLIGLAAAFLGALFFLGTLIRSPFGGSKAEQVLKRGLRLYTRGQQKKKESSSFAESIQRRAVELAEKVPRSKQFDERFQKMIDQAGWSLRSTEFVLLQIGAALFGALLGFGLFQQVPFGVVLMALGFAAPRLVLSQRMAARQAAFLSQLPDTLQLLSASLQAGYGFLQALDTCSKETSPPASVEFSRALAEARLGMPVEQALESMSDRLGSEDFRWVVMAINIQRQVGGNLAQLLTTVSNTLREREAVRRQIKVLSAEGRLSAVILVCLPFALAGYIQLVNPGYIGQLTEATIGKIAIAMGLVLIGLGIIWMRKIIKIDV